MVAGFDSPSTVLSYCLHTLANQPDVQEQLYSEILTNDVTNHDLSKYIYLDAFIKEVLRMNPTAVQFVHRRCNQDTEVQGYKIPKGSVRVYTGMKSNFYSIIYFLIGSLVQADVYTIHYDLELWGPLPVDEFHLERHMTKRHPLALLAFGAGPRQCIGLRFAFSKI
jgi:cytochrome P450